MVVRALAVRALRKAAAKRSCKAPAERCSLMGGGWWWLVQVYPALQARQGMIMDSLFTVHGWVTTVLVY